MVHEPLWTFDAVSQGANYSFTIKFIRKGIIYNSHQDYRFVFESEEDREKFDLELHGILEYIKDHV